MIAVCITTYNEHESIAALVTFFRRSGYPVYVVDDGSTDGTDALADVLGAHVIQTGGKWGIGPSLMVAWRTALLDGATTIVQIDAGGSHSPLNAQKLLDVSTLLGADLVIGSRFIPGAQYLHVGNKRGVHLRPLLSRLAAKMCNYAQGNSRIQDWTSGYRVFSKPLLEYLLTKDYIAKMHGWQIETLAYAQEQGFRIAEAPISYVAGRSSFNRKVAYEASLVWLHLLHHVGWVNSKLGTNDARNS